MPKPTKGPRLGGGPTHERLILNQLAAQLFEHKRIETTVTKAKRLRPVAEKLITKAKKGDLASRRLVMKQILDKAIVHELFTEIAPLLADREGGYTRIIRTGFRKGDNAPLAVIELVLEPVVKKQRAAAADASVAEEEVAAEETADEVAEDAASEEATEDATESADAVDAGEDAAEEPAAEDAAAEEETPAEEASDEADSETKE